MADDDLAMWQGKKVIDPDGDKIGTVDDLFVDEETRRPEWLFVDTGMFGTNVFVPASEARFPDDDTVQVPFTKDQVKNAPDISVGDTLSTDDERRLYDYYGVTASGEESTTTLPEEHEGAGGETPETSASITSDADTSAPGTSAPVAHGSSSPPAESGVTGRERVRVKKRIVTEPKTVYVEREEIVVERQPAGGETAGATGPAGGDVREEVLYEDEITPEHEVDRGEEHAA